VFYGAPPPELLTLFSIWPADILVIVMPDDTYASARPPAPLHSWALMEDGNQSMRQLPVMPIYLATEPFMSNDDIILPPPPPSTSSPPLSYAEAVPAHVWWPPATACTPEVRNHRRPTVEYVEWIHSRRTFHICCVPLEASSCPTGWHEAVRWCPRCHPTNTIGVDFDAFLKLCLTYV